MIISEYTLWELHVDEKFRRFQSRLQVGSFCLLLEFPRGQVTIFIEATRQIVAAKSKQFRHLVTCVALISFVRKRTSEKERQEKKPRKKRLFQCFRGEKSEEKKI